MGLLQSIHPNIRWRLLVGSLTTAVTMMVSPYLVIFFVGKIGTTNTGLLYMATIVCAIAGSLFGGYLSDRIGRKKVMVVSEAMIALTMFAIAVLNSPWLSLPYWTASLFLINMFFNGSFRPVTLALTVDCSPRSSREMVFRLNYWANNLSIAIGSLIGGLLFVRHSFTLFLFVAAASGLSVVVTLIFIREEYVVRSAASLPTTSDTEGMPWRQHIVATYLSTMQDRKFLYFFIASLFMFTIENQLTNYIGVNLIKHLGRTTLLSMANIHWSVGGVGLLGMLKSENTIVVVAGALFIARITNRLSQQFKILAGTLMFTAGFSVLAFSSSAFILVLAMLLATVGELVYTPVQQSLLGSIAPENQRSVYMSMYQVSMYAAEIAAGIIIMFSNRLSPIAVGVGILVVGSAGAVGFRFSLKADNGHRRQVLQTPYHNDTFGME